MGELNGRFEEFIKALRPSDGQYSAAKDELDFLEKKLSNFIADDDEYTFVKALRSGSYSKDTILKRHDKGDFDADIAIYLKSKNGKPIDPLKAIAYLEKLLRKAYKNRTERTPSFDPSTNSALRVKFEDHPKINLDVVCVEAIDHKTIKNLGEILRKDGTRRLTSITEHISFVTDRNAKFTDTPFNQLVMLWKWWRNHKFPGNDHDKVCSFFLELYVGRAFDSVRSGFGNSWVKNMLDMAQWMLRHRFSEAVWFEDARISKPSSWPNDSVVVIDPVNSSNNVTHPWKIKDKDGFLLAVQEFAEILTDAYLAEQADDLEDELEQLDKIFPQFSQWSE